MYKTELVFNGKKRNVSFFNDDTIDIVRQQISKSIDIHPDRLFILVGVKLPRNYYKQDSRNWETLFYRLSLNGMPIMRETFNSYCSEYRIPNIQVEYGKLDIDEWMTYPDLLRDLYDPGGDFTEYRIFGVEPIKSYILPFEINPQIATRISSAQYPMPDNGKLFLSLYKPEDTRGFFIKEYEKGYEGGYFPFFRATTPSRLSESQIQILDNNSLHLKDLLSLDPPAPKSIHILRASWRVQIVDTEFGDAVRTRFEQIFYGMTVSKRVPSITFFTGRSEVSRHKFYKKTAQTRKPYLDLPVWSAWWTKSKPARDRIPTLVLYRGKDREIFDRITVTSQDIIFAVYRDTSNTKTLDELKTEILTWFQDFDALLPFIEESDITPCRVELQDIRFDAEYSDSLDDFDTRRMNCLSGIFEEHKKEKTVFKFLRSDDANDGITPIDLKLINMIRDDPMITPADISEEFKISLSDSTKMLTNISLRIQDQPNLLTRQYRNFPALLMKQKSVEVSSVNEIDRFLKYTNILRYILSNPTSKSVDKICPKRIETVEPIISTINTDFVDTEFSDLFGYLEGDVIAEPVPVENKPTGKTGTLYNYFNRRLQEFDKETFDPTGSDYPKKCEQSHQPIILSDAEIQEILSDSTKGAEFDPNNYDDKKKLEVQDPHGIVICPEYWCMFDKVPLQETQLETIDGIKMCPICHGKVRGPKDTKSDTREFSVIQRTKGFSYPGMMEYLSPKNKRNLPCCYKSSKERKLKVDDKDGKYYILDENKTGLNSMRIAYISKKLLKSIKISETYALAVKSGNRIQTGMSGYFRIGLGSPSEGLPQVLGLDIKVSSPRHSIDTVLRCSFVATWTKVCEAHNDAIESKLVDIEPFKSCILTRKHMTKTIASIDDYYTRGELSKLEELEYVSIFLKTDVFRISLEDMTMGCTFYSQQVKLRTRGIIILQRGNDIDSLTYVTRKQKVFEYISNVYEPPFGRDTFSELENKRIRACVTDIPAFKDAVLFVSQLNKTFSVILDPHGRAQALYIPGELILPFQNVNIKDISNPKIQGYKEVDNLPSYDDMIVMLRNAQKVKAGYAWAEDMYDSNGQRTEILTKSGLRIPVKPEKMEGEPSEIMSTIIKEGETQLTLGEENKEDMQRYKSISYTSELYEFLIFQLTNDIHDDYTDLKNALSEPSPNRSDLEPELEKWFNETTHFVKSDTPIEFLSKIRKPCGQFKRENTCDAAHMCAWNNKQCRIQVRDTISKPKLLNKLLSTLMDNSKIRAMILDGRTTPFFSTILYIDLPNEIIFTDYELKELNATT
jgi:hypothetical protein